MMSGEVFIGQGKVAPQNFLAFTGMLAFPHVLLGPAGSLMVLRDQLAEGVTTASLLG